jgi:tetratricopeptide (TPR) repeat protein
MAAEDDAAKSLKRESSSPRIAPLPEPPPILDQSYVLAEALGEGGMGSVYRAERRADGRVVALKLVAGPGPIAQKGWAREPWLAIAREFEILSSLHHPNVVRVLDYGFDERQGPYFTMELLPDARDLLCAGRDAPLGDKIEFLTQLLRALTYVHRRGIIHRDIKPSNVLLVGHTVKLLDFGVAIAGSQSRRLAGTRPYMAPELLRGVAPSVRSDLYAFGVLAGALLGGWSSASAVSTTRITETALPSELPSQHSLVRELFSDEHGEVYQDLDLILAKLCAPEPEHRYASAAEVLSDLERAVHGTLPLETAETRESFLQASEFVGREGELEQLLSALSAARAGHGSGWLVGGESGVGKSRLALELSTQAMVRGVCVVQGQALAEGGSSYESWLPVLRALCLRAELPLETLSALKELLPDLPALLGRDIPNSPPLAMPGAETRLIRAIEDVFRRQSKPVLVVLEDVHWANGDSLALLATLAKVAPELPLMLLATYRHDEAPGLPAALPGLWAIALDRLERKHVARLGMSMLGPSAGRAGLIDYLCRETEGNPFFLVEVVRALAEQAGQLGDIHRVDLTEGLLTGGIERIVLQRLGRVPRGAYALLEVAAALGRQLDLPVLAHLARDVELESWLLVCANAAVLETRASNWRFAHDKLRESLLSRLEPERRTAIYQRVVRAMHAVYGERERELKSALLAHYCQEAGDAPGAARYHLIAGDTATRRCSYLVARKHYCAALTLLEAAPVEPEQRRVRVDALLKQVYVTMVSDPAATNLSRMSEAKALLLANAESKPLSRADRLRMARADYLLGRVHFYRGDSRQALAHYREVLPVAQESGDDELLALPSCLIAITLAMQGEMRRSEPLLSQAIAPLERLGEPFEWFRAVGYHGFVLIALGRTTEGDQKLARVHERASEIGQASLWSAAHLMRGSGHTLLTGDYPRALADMAEVRRFAGQTGDKLHLSLALSNSAWALAQLGRFEEARDSRQRAREFAEAMGGRVMLSDWHEAADAELLLLEGRYEEAEELARLLCERSRPAGQLASLGLAERVWGEALYRRGQRTDGEQHLQESLDVLDSAGIVLQSARTRFRRGLCLRQGGRSDEASDDLRESLAVFDATNCSYAQDELRRALQ